MTTLRILPIEPLENRYTKHWYDYFPDQFRDHCPEYEVIQISGHVLDNKTDEGAFLNFSSTSHFKATQMAQVAKIFAQNLVKDGDVFLVTDAWNPCAHMIRYMADLAGIKVKMMGFWHAGHYDPHDLLAQRFTNSKWAEALEQSMFELYDCNVFATGFHQRLFGMSVNALIRNMSLS